MSKKLNIKKQNNKIREMGGISDNHTGKEFIHPANRPCGGKKQLWAIQMGVELFLDRFLLSAIMKRLISEELLDLI